MKKFILFLFGAFLIFQCAFGQNLTKIVVSKFENGKPELVNYYRGEATALNLVKQEKYGGDGKKTVEKNFLNGKMHGIVMYWKDFDGTLQASLLYADGEMSGQQMFYYSDGSTKAELNYTNGKMDGRQVEYYFKSELETPKSEHNYSGGVLHGMQRSWDKEGKLAYNFNFVAGKPDGIQRTYSETGGVEEEKWVQGTYEEVIKNWTAAQPRHAKVFDYQIKGDSVNIIIGKVPQKEVWYFETGGIEALTTMIDPIETQVFYMGGKVKARGAGTMEKKEGPWQYWFQDGNKWKSGEYKDGKPVGLFTTLNKFGKVTEEEFWNPNGSGREVWKIINYSPSGAKESDGQLDPDGHKKGMWKYYYPNGERKAEEDWQMSCDQGKGRPFLASIAEWDDAGRLIVKGNEADQQQWTYFPNGNPMEMKTIVYPNRNPCSKAPVSVWKEDKFVVEMPAPGNYNESVMVAKVVFFESGDTLNISEYDMDGKRKGYQKGWFSDGKKQYEYHYVNGMPQGTVLEWYPTGEKMLDLKVNTTGGSPSTVSGTYWSEKGKDYEYAQGDKMKKAIVEIDAASYFARFWQENK